MHTTIIQHPFAEKKTAKFSGKITDESGVGVLPSAIKLTLYDRQTLAIVNSRSGGSILNINGGTCDANGNWTLTLTPADMAILDTTNRQELRTALVEWTYGGTKEGGAEIRFTIDNLEKVT